MSPENPAKDICSNVSNVNVVPQETFFFTEDLFEPWTDEYLQEVDADLCAREKKRNDNHTKGAPSPEYWSASQDTDTPLMNEAVDEAERLHVLRLHNQSLHNDSVRANASSCIPTPMTLV